jgi:3-oxoacyl-[acyl-carrier protein] reductase
MPIELSGKKALVTGSSRGMGLAIAEALASEGLRIFLTARNEPALKKAKNDLESKGVAVGFAAADLADVGRIEKMFESAISFLGGIDILVNNAGLGIKAPVINLSAEEWETMYAVNLRAPFILSKLAAGKMTEQGSGHIINIGSGASQTPIAEFAGYCATKFGLLGLSESMALELRKFGVKVSIIMPGTTATHFGGGDPQSKLASKPGILRPADVAEAVVFLLKQSPGAWTSTMNIRPLNP